MANVSTSNVATTLITTTTTAKTATVSRHSNVIGTNTGNKILTNLSKGPVIINPAAILNMNPVGGNAVAFAQTQAGKINAVANPQQLTLAAASSSGGAPRHASVISTKATASKSIINLTKGLMLNSAALGFGNTVVGPIGAFTQNQMGKAQVTVNPTTFMTLTTATSGSSARPESVTITNATGNKPGFFKGVIINPASVPTLNSGNTMHAVASFATQNQAGKTPIVSVNPTLVTLSATTASASDVTRHTVLTTGMQQKVVHQHSTNATNATAVLNKVVHNMTQLQPPQSTLTTTTLRPTVLSSSSPASSPVKQYQIQTTPSSPRPSILIRKRAVNDSLGSPFKAAVPSSTTSASLASPTKVTSVTVNSNDLSKLTTTTLSAASQEVVESSTSETNTQLTSTPSGATTATTAPITPNSDGSTTPRKKPRKQLLEPFNLSSMQNMQLLSGVNTNGTRSEEDHQSMVQISKKPRLSLLSYYNMPSKPLQNHFLRYSDVRPKPEKKLTLSELSNEGLQRKNGWKIHHLATQMEVISDNEVNLNERLNAFLQTFKQQIENNSTSSSDSNASGVVTNSNSVPTTNANNTPFDANNVTSKLNDLIKGNLQRSNLFTDQINEARQLVIKLTNDHKERFGKITKKCANKRTYITKC